VESVGMSQIPSALTNRLVDGSLRTPLLLGATVGPRLIEDVHAFMHHREERSAHAAADAYQDERVQAASR